MSGRKEGLFYSRRLIGAKIFVCFFIGLLCVRIWYLQVLNGAYYRDLSENNRIRTIRTVSPRGTVFDREGRVLVRNRPAFDVALILEDTPDVKATVAKIAELTGREAERLYEQFKAQKGGRRFEPKVVLHDVSREELARVKSQSHQLPGVIIRAIPTRAYPNNQAAAQVFGYTREVSKAQLEQLKELDYKPGDVIGQSGLEKRFEPVLRGVSGYVQVEVDAMGNRKKELGIIDDKPGKDMFLSLDIDLQLAGERAMEGKRGAVVAIDPNNGEVLALVSSPSFDANIFSGQMLAREWEELARDPRKPLSNRAIAYVYPPGSTSKLLWAVAGLQEKKIGPTTELNCPGYVLLGKRRYQCHKKTGHGSVNLETAITVSCNAYFYNLGQYLGIEGLTKYMDLFGLGRPTGIELPGEEPGTLPSEEWKQKRFGERWYPGDTVPVSIGQGYMVVSPLQMAMLMGSIVNGGKRYEPLLVKKIVDVRSGEEEIFQPRLIADFEGKISKEALDTVRRFAGSVVEHPRGTGKRAKLSGVHVGGKTGTAQVGRRGTEHLGEYFKDHAWFISFAPVENPQIAMAVVVENSGHGGEFAAPVTKQVMEVFFRKKGMLIEEPLPETKQKTPAEAVDEEASEPSEGVPSEELPSEEVPREDAPNEELPREDNLGNSSAAEKPPVSDG